ncbi:MAG: FAD-dependent oxidoreductase [Candidatus Omnitrophica bacterium]|nr:FAD-dependent oxidoreductase [Candidatus Omnitrophota bacterium]
MSNIRKPIVVVGAGITGCVIAYKLSRAGKKVILIEKENEVGGLARTFRYGDYTFDIGPHRFYIGNKEIFSFLREILKEDYEIIQRNSSVFFLGKYHTWPLNPWIMFNLPISILFKSFYELLVVLPRKRNKKIEHFKDYIMKYYGPTLYNTFFRSYTQKFLKLYPEETHSNWAQEAIKRTIIDERMASRNLWEILKMTFLFFPLRTEFLYPAGGIDLFCRRLAEEAQEAGAEIHVNSHIESVKLSSTKIEGVIFGHEEVKPEKLIWTGNLRNLCELSNVPIGELNYLNLILFNVLLKKPIKKDFQWCYYGSDDLIFSRITLPSRFNQNLVPKGKESLCVEVTCNGNDPCWQAPESLIGQIQEDLKKMGLVETIADIDNIYIEKISNAYPVYTRDYPQHLCQVKESLSKFENLSLAGRTGLFWYNNMDDSIEHGLKLAKWILQDRE